MSCPDNLVLIVNGKSKTAWGDFVVMNVNEVLTIP